MDAKDQGSNGGARDRDGEAAGRGRGSSGGSGGGGGGGGSSSSSSWGGWLSSVANSAIGTVLGESNHNHNNKHASEGEEEEEEEEGAAAAVVPETFESLETNHSIDRDASAANEFSQVDSASRQALWKQLVSVIGMDVMNMRLSLPIWLFEPTTALTRMCETFEFSELLDRAANETDPVLRDALVAAFVVSAFAHTERVRKPFNPVLAFAFQDTRKGVKFLAEQVSHHPPISVSQCEGPGWTAGESVDVKATYMGNSIHISNSGPMASRFVTLLKSKDHYTWTLPKAVVSNLFIGGTFIDHFGDIELINHTTGTKSILKLTKCGWFSSGRYQVSGQLLDADATIVATYEGFWNKYLDFNRVVRAHGQGTLRLWAAGKHLLSDAEGGGPDGALPKFTKFGSKILALNDEIKRTLPVTDSRLRPDRLALQKKDTVQATSEKLRVEQGQRDRSKEMESEGNAHEPKWFKLSGSGDNAKWEFNADANYWEYVSRPENLGKSEDAMW